MLETSLMYTETTPNPLALKFILEKDVVTKGDYVFSSAQEVSGQTVLEEIFSLPGVQSLFLTQGFLTVTKTLEVSWSLLESVILSVLQHHEKDFPLNLLDQPQKILAPSHRFEGWTPPTPEIADICKEIDDLLDGHVRPAIAEDGGAISFVAFEDGIVYVHLQGACDGCGHAEETLKHGIEKTLTYYIPEVQGVTAIG